MERILPILNVRILLSVAFVAFSSCSWIPRNAKRLDRHELAAPQQPPATGVLAFAPIGEPLQENLHLDLRHLESDRLYRVSLNPNGLEPSKVPLPSKPDQPPASRVVGPGVAFFRLPIGTYRPRFLGSTSSAGFGHPQISSYPITGDTLSILPGAITSLGFLEYTWDFRGWLKSPLHLEIIGPDIDTLIRSSTDTSLSWWSIRRSRLRIDP